MSFIGVLESVGKDFAKGLSWAMKYAVPAEKLAALLFPQFQPELATVSTATALIQKTVLLVEQKYAASGIASGTGTQKLAEVVLLAGDAVAALLSKAGIDSDPGYIQSLVSAVVAILNVQSPVAQADEELSSTAGQPAFTTTRRKSMENEIQHLSEAALDQLIARFTAAVERLEHTQSERALPGINVAAGDAVGPIVAMVETSREAELTQKLVDAEQTIAALRANASTHTHEGRKTLPTSLLAKQDGGFTDASALDAALGSLSMEQRIAVKSQLLRAGLV